MAAQNRKGPGGSGPGGWIWVDAQLPPVMARWFRTDLGIEATHVADLGFLAAKDGVIFEAAQTADPAVVLVTKDDDFRKLVDQHGPPPQVVWVRCGNITNAELRRLLLAGWARVAALLASGEQLVELRQRRPGQLTGR